VCYALAFPVSVCKITTFSRHSKKKRNPDRVDDLLMKKRGCVKNVSYLCSFEDAAKNETKCLETSGFAADAVGGCACLGAEAYHV
jgi:hypothetical protein